MEAKNKDLLKKIKKLFKNKYMPQKVMAIDLGVPESLITYYKKKFNIKRG